MSTTSTPHEIDTKAGKEPILTYQLFNNKCDICTEDSTLSMCQKCLSKVSRRKKRYVLMAVTGTAALLVSYFGFHINAISAVSYGMGAVGVVGAVYIG